MREFVRRGRENLEEQWEQADIADAVHKSDEGEREKAKEGEGETRRNEITLGKQTPPVPSHLGEGCPATFLVV